MQAMKRLTLEPAEPTGGRPATISYGFEGLAVDSVMVDVRWYPSDVANGSQERISRSSPTLTLTVPQRATQGLLVDLTGGSRDVGFFVQRPGRMIPLGRMTIGDGLRFGLGFAAAQVLFVPLCVLALIVLGRALELLPAKW